MGREGRGERVWKSFGRLADVDSLCRNWLPSVIVSAIITSISTFVAFLRQAPLWQLAILWVLMFIVALLALRYMAGRKLQREVPACDLPEEHLGQVDFLPSSPLEHGWRFAELASSAQRPKFYTADKAPERGSITICAQGEYKLDYALLENLQCANVAKFLYKLPASVYFHVRMISRDGQRHRTGYLGVGHGSDAPHNWNDGEWQVFANAKPLAAGWYSATFALEDAVQQSFGQEGWRFDALLEIRVRGNTTVSPIVLLRAPSNS